MWHWTGVTLIPPGSLWRSWSRGVVSLLGWDTHHWVGLVSSSPSASACPPSTGTYIAHLSSYCHDNYDSDMLFNDSNVSGWSDLITFRSLKNSLRRESAINITIIELAMCVCVCKSTPRMHRCQHGLRKMRESARNNISRTHANFARVHKCEQNTTYPYTLTLYKM